MLATWFGLYDDALGRNHNLMSWTNHSRPLHDDEYPEPDEENDDAVIPCPECGQLVYEEALQCPACSAYLTQSTSPWSGRATWWIALGLLGILGTLWALLGLS